jgi:hypothetical protein
VQTGLENANSYTITSETLKEGDEVIISGNVNLAHESPVTVIDEIERSGDSPDTSGDSNATDD